MITWDFFHFHSRRVIEQSRWKNSPDKSEERILSRVQVLPGGEEKEEETIFYQFNQEQEEFSGQIFLAIIHLSLDPFLIEFY